MELGTITNVAQGARATNAPQNGAWGPTETGSLRKHLDDDAGAAVIQNLHRAENSSVGQSAIDGRPAATLGQRLQQFTASFSEGLARYKELSEKVAGGRFSPTILREQIELRKEAAGVPGADYPDTVTGVLAFLSSDSNSASKGCTDTRALIWLKDQAQQALSSQKNIEPGRALVLLRDMISPSAAKPGEKWAVAPAGKGDEHCS